MSETIKAKTSQRLSSRRRVSCPLRRVSLSALRGNIVPLLLVLLAVLADASYPSVLPPKPLFVPSVEKKTKRCLPWNDGLYSSSSHAHLKDSWPSKRTPSRPGPCRTPRCPSYEAFANSVVLDADSPICRVLMREHDA